MCGWSILKGDLSDIPPVIDFEASGLDIVGSYPISVRVSTHSDNYYELIKPIPDWTHWCKDAERIHKLSRDHLIDHGLSPPDVVEGIERLLPSDRTLFSDNPRWDGFWANRLGMTKIDIRSVKELVPFGKRNKLKRVSEKIREDFGFCHHKAIDDAISLRLAVCCLRQKTN